MKRFFAIVLCLISLTTTALADSNTQYVIIVDAGSTGSRLHLFQIAPYLDNTIPYITEVFSEKVSPGLSDYADHPDEASSSLQTLFDDASTQMTAQGIDPQTVRVNVLATAGMRLLSDEQQQNIYRAIRNDLMKDSTFKIGDIRTISGEEEALYDWLDVNYIGQRFQLHLPPLGIIDMGGASTEIAFVSSTDSKDIMTVHLGDDDYSVLVKSFLGLGTNEALKSMNNSNQAKACYPDDDPLAMMINGQFDFATCEPIYQNIIDRANVARELPALSDQKFIGFSGINYVFDFFDAKSSPNKTQFEQRINTICSMSWSELKQHYPSIEPQYLSTYCATGVYQDALLFDTYKLQSSQLTITDTINNQSIDWALGAALYGA